MNHVCLSAGTGCVHGGVLREREPLLEGARQHQAESCDRGVHGRRPPGPANQKRTHLTQRGLYANVESFISFIFDI